MWWLAGECSQIGAVIQKLSKHKDETPENKRKLKEIIDNWSRLLTGKLSAKRRVAAEVTLPTKLPHSSST